MNNTKVVIGGVLIGILALVSGFYIYMHNKEPESMTRPISNQAVSSMSPNQPQPVQLQGSNGQQITVAGAIQCLSPKSSDGRATTLSCAISLVTDDSKTYSLNSADPSLTGSLPTGQKVEITGSLSGQNAQNDTAGVISIDSIKRL